MSHGTRTCIKRKKLSMVNFLIFVQKNVSRIRFQEIKIRPLKGFEKMQFLCFYIREGVKKSKWKFKMAFAIRGLTPPLNGKISRHFFTPLFFFCN